MAIVHIKEENYFHLKMNRLGISGIELKRITALLNLEEASKAVKEVFIKYFR